MRTVLLLLPLAAALGGCAVGVVPREAWNFDPTSLPVKASLPAEEAAALTDRLARLQIQRNAVRARIANERDAGARQQQYGELHRIGTELSPLERRLATVAVAR